FRSSLVRSIVRPVSSRRLVHVSAVRRSVEPIPTPEGSGAGAEVAPKVSTIVDQVAQLTLLETSQLVEALKTKFNITEAVHVAASSGAPAAAAAAPAEEKPVEKTEFKVKLEKIDAAQKAKVIREIKNIVPDMNL
ncbi:54S ribosomal protein L12, mitochondrial, partial [Coemansia sp. RSA 486]